MSLTYRCPTTFESPLNLVLNEKNSALHPPEQIAALIKSFQTFGFVGSVVVGTDMRILAGHGRVMAALEAGIEEIPVIDMSDLPEHLQDAFMLADNKISDMKTYDEDLLQMEIDRLIELDPSLEGLGFGEIDLDALMAGIEHAPGGGIYREHEERKDGLPSPDDDFDKDEGREKEKEEDLVEHEEIDVEEFDATNRSVHRDELKVREPSSAKSGIKELTCPHCGEVFKARKQDCAA